MEAGNDQILTTRIRSKYRALEARLRRQRASALIFPAGLHQLRSAGSGFTKARIMWQAISGEEAMVYAQQQRSYQCDRCGSPEIVALSLLYERGTRTRSGPAYWGISQSFSAQNAEPPRQKGYGGPGLLCGFLLAFLSFWFGLSLRHTRNSRELRSTCFSFSRCWRWLASLDLP